MRRQEGARRKDRRRLEDRTAGQYISRALVRPAPSPPWPPQGKKRRTITAELFGSVTLIWQPVTTGEPNSTGAVETGKILQFP